MSSSVSRRNFLKGSLVAGAAAATGGFLTGNEVVSANDVTWDEEADVIIIGGGGTGLVAAIEAVESNGASVIVLEKAAAVGGTTSVSGGIIQAAGTSFQKEHTDVQDDTPEKHAEYWNNASEGIADPEIVSVLAENAPGNIDWLVAHGINYISVYGVSRIPNIDPELMVPRIHVIEGGGGGAHT